MSSRIPPNTRLRSAFSIRPGAIVASSAASLLALALIACGNPSVVDPAGGEGPLAPDAYVVLDQYAYSSAACAEVAASPAEDSLDAEPLVRVAIVATSCYSVRTVIEDSLGTPVRVLSRRFAIRGREEGEKDRGVLGYLPWDGRDGEARAVPPGAYLWRMEFDFGGGRVHKFRAITDITDTAGTE